MTIFAVLMPHSQPALIEEIKRLFPEDYLSLNDTQYLISARGTVVEISIKLGLYNETQHEKKATSVAVILATSSYFGRAPAIVWDWMKTKLESAPSG